MKFITLLAVFVFFSTTVHADKLLEITRERNGLTTKYIVDENHMVSIVGLPIAGAYYYNANTGTLYAQMAGDGITYAVPYGRYSLRVPNAKIEKQGDWKEYFGTKSVYWRAVLNGQTCGHIFANAAASSKTGLDATDFSRMQTALSYLMGPAPDECGPYLIEPAAGRLMGLPIYGIHQGSGTSEVIEIVETEGPPNNLTIPTTVELNAAAHTRFMKTMLNGAELRAFEAASGQLPWRLQVKALKQILRQKIEQK